MRVLAALLLFLMLGLSCHKKTVPAAPAKALGSNCFRARLEIKGMCMNYVIRVLEGDVTRLNVEREWKDETDGSVYTNVFALGSRCSFPDLAEGDEFYFSVTGVEDANCNVCLAYRPVPAAKNNIIVSKNACP